MLSIPTKIIFVCRNSTASNKTIYETNSLFFDKRYADVNKTKDINESVVISLLSSKISKRPRIGKIEKYNENRSLKKLIAIIRAIKIAETWEIILIAMYSFIFATSDTNLIK